MIITAKHAKKLIREGKATQGGVAIDNGAEYQAIDRHDKQRVDHYYIGDAP